LRRYIKQELGLGKDEAAKVISKFPNLLGSSVENTITPIVQYLEEEVGLGKDETVKVITKFPNLLGLSVENALAPTVRQVLTLVHILAQPEPFLSLKTPKHPTTWDVKCSR
jgi:hypothetical protein